MKSDLLRSLGRKETFLMGLVLGLVVQMFIIAFITGGCVDT